MRKAYDQYCPVAHALDLVGDRWALLIVRELMLGPRRYTDLAERLPRIGTNILAARLRDLETHGVLTKRRLPPPTPVQVYELTDYGLALRPVLRELALWGAPLLGPPSNDAELFPGWLQNALGTLLAPYAPPGRFEFRIGDEHASLVDGEARGGGVDDPDVVVEGDPQGVYHMFFAGDLDAVSVEGDRGLLEQLLASIPRPAEPVAAPA